LHDCWAEGTSPAAVVAGAAAAIGAVTIAAAAAPAAISNVKRLGLSPTLALLFMVRADGAQTAGSEQKGFAAIGIKADGRRCVVDLDIAG
jgi:hypothetical protein